MTSSPEHRRRDGLAAGECIDLSFSSELAITPSRSILIGDGIENPGNVDCLQETASIFDWDYAFLDGSRLSCPASGGLSREELTARDRKSTRLNSSH